MLLRCSSSPHRVIFQFKLSHLQHLVFLFVCDITIKMVSVTCPLSLFSIVLGASALTLWSASAANTTTSPQWVYTLQLGSVDRIKTVPTDNVHYMISDYSTDGLKANQLSANDVKAIKARAKTALSYLSIGEAESYRFYWNATWSKPSSKPSFLGLENPQWKGNYKVKFWDPKWKALIFQYLDAILDAGWDGVYLDIIDAYYYWSDKQSAAKEGVAPLKEDVSAQRMMTFVKEIAAYGRQRNPNFLVFPQNAEEIIDYDDDKNSYLATVNGVGVEDVFYDGTKKASETNSRVTYLRQYVQAKKTVLSVDYVDDASGCKGANLKRIQDYVNLARKEKFVTFAGTSNRELKATSPSCMDQVTA